MATARRVLVVLHDVYWWVGTRSYWWLGTSSRVVVAGAHQRQYLQQMILHDVTDNAVLVEVTATALGADGLLTHHLRVPYGQMHAG